MLKSEPFSVYILLFVPFGNTLKLLVSIYNLLYNRLVWSLFFFLQLISLVAGASLELILIQVRTICFFHWIYHSSLQKKCFVRFNISSSYQVNTHKRIYFILIRMFWSFHNVYPCLSNHQFLCVELDFLWLKVGSGMLNGILGILLGSRITPSQVKRNLLQWVQME